MTKKQLENLSNVTNDIADLKAQIDALDAQMKEAKEKAAKLLEKAGIKTYRGVKATITQVAESKSTTLDKAYVLKKYPELSSDADAFKTSIKNGYLNVTYNH